MKKIFSLIILAIFFTMAVFAAPSMVGSVTEISEENSPIVLEEVAQLSADEDYGELVLDIDFEGRTAGTAGFTSLLPDEYKGSAISGMPSTFTVSEGNGFTLADAAFLEENGNTFMRYTAVKSYVQFYLKSAKNLPVGTYTLSIDMRSPTVNGKTPVFNYNTMYSSFTDISGRGNLIFYEDTPDFVNKVYRGELKADSALTTIEYLISYAGAGSVIDYDNIRIWYDSGAYTVNFNDGGMGSDCSSISDSVNVTKGQSIRLSDYSAVSSSGVKFVGWSLLPFGDVIDTDTFTPTKSTTLYAVWDFGSKIVDVDFEDSDLGSKLTSTIADSYYPAKNYQFFNQMFFEESGSNLSFANTEIKSESNGNKYLSLKTSSKYSFFKLKNKNGYPEGTYTFAYIAKMDKHGDGATEIALNSMCNWADNSYSSQMQVLSQNVAKVSFKADDSTWKAFRITAKTLNTHIIENFIALITDSTKNSTVGIDNIVIYYNAPDVSYTADVSVNEYDYRKGQFDITLSEDFGISASEAYNLFFATKGVFDADCKVKTNDDGSVTYSFFEEEAYKGKSVTLVDEIVYKTPESSMRIAMPESVAGKTYTFNTIPDDGENLVPNGNLTNPYLIPFTNIGEFKPVTISNGAFNIEMRTDLESWSIRQSLITNQVDFEAGESYYVDIDLDFVKYAQFADGTPNPYTDGKGDVVYVYVPNSLASGSAAKERPSYIKGMTTKNNFGIDKARYGVDQGNYSIVYKPDKDFMAAEMNLNFDFSYGVSLYADTKANGKIKNVGGLGFELKNITVKKMYDVNILGADGKVAETRLAAKDVAITLPASFELSSSTDTFLGWTDGENTYRLGSEFVLTEAGDVTLTPVIQGIAPKSYKQNSIRINDPQGIRFKSAVTNKVKSDEKTAEYGFLVTRESLLGSKSAEELTFEQNEIKYVVGVSYGIDPKTEKFVDRIYELDDTFTYFTAAVYGVAATKENYEENIVVRPYIKYDSETIYGEPMLRSILDTAVAIRDSGYEGYDEYAKTCIKKILEICGLEK